MAEDVISRQGRCMISMMELHSVVIAIRGTDTEGLKSHGLSQWKRYGGDQLSFNSLSLPLLIPLPSIQHGQHKRPQAPR